MNLLTKQKYNYRCINRTQTSLPRGKGEGLINGDRD